MREIVFKWLAKHYPEYNVNEGYKIGDEVCNIFGLTYKESRNIIMLFYMNKWL